MKIGELAQRTNLAPSRIRFYEASGLIAAQRHANGYRHYPAHAVHTLEIILNAQRAGFSLEEIRRFLPDNNEAGWKHDEILGSLQRKVAEIEAMQERLAQNKARLLEIITNIENRPEGMGCDGNAERVLAQMREGTCSEAQAGQHEGK
ncbi:MerR family transcriptional regulator [Pseudomonas turukhanskensis]|uniref:Transcriptional regulator n=1 Tax=Pseudomonas turukhanskensis TaxID=1806536 RepID=A0A9W6NEH8_9PSED|nr:MerR family transcriptional regulator [Pseudomonas turukhanskensis]GLK88003.1 transcriptional regulator [Pseudomonas turukhanskensis]